MFTGSTWKLQEQVKLLHQLGDLLEKGYSLWHALEFLQFYLNEPKKEQLQQAVEELKTGSSLYAVFAKLAFHADILGYLFYAEQHGDIAFALQQGSAMLNRKDKHSKKMKKVLQYPLFLLLFLLGMVWIFNAVLLPQFSSLYHTIQTPSPLSDAVLACLQALPYAVAVLVIFMVIFSVYMLYVKTLHPVEQMNIWLRLPLLQTACRSLNSHYFAVQVSCLLEGGLSVRQIFILMEQQQHHSFFQWEAKDITRLLAGGETLDRILQQRPYYEKELSYVIAHGQANGKLGKELADYSEIVVEKLEARINRLVLIIQPVLFAVIGIIIVMMYLAMILPMFTMMGSI